MALTPLDEAISAILAGVEPVTDNERVPLGAASGRILASSTISSIDVPPCDRSAMDGYAIRVSEVPGRLKVTQRILAGMPPLRLSEGEAARIFTGGVIPSGADAVVLQEDVRAEREWVTVIRPVAPGSNIRLKGQDFVRGKTLFERGYCLQAVDLGVLASSGLNCVRVYRPLRVAILSTGDELIEPGARPAGVWQIYNSNHVQLQQTLRGMGFSIVDGGLVSDDPALIAGALSELSEVSDCILTTGGVSVGDADFVTRIMQESGSLTLWKIGLKPGKPLAVGSLNGTPLFGLPGNPVSAWVTLVVVVKAWLQKRQGVVTKPIPDFTVTSEFSYDNVSARDEFMRVVCRDNDLGISIARSGNQDSGILSGVSRSDGVLRIRAGQHIVLGQKVTIIPRLYAEHLAYATLKVNF